ncbi:hypothetical protein JTE90_002118 [Oedothorax gibbosus]|uniref:DUF2428 domain-containing protein n=1 Tax=Oedothorax gibbosus TaxID=931172 RepID=A0AAV6V8K3_9ARAC|nr:hypothetical protein JTE90_002118 [Oedothorax gibbosus]
MSCEDTFKELGKVSAKLSTSNSLPDTHSALKELYRAILKFQIKFENIAVLTTENQHIFLSLVQRLVFIISNSVFPADSILLGGTCLAVLVAELFNPDFASTFLVLLYVYIGESSIDNNTTPSDLKPLKNLTQQCTEQSHALHSAIQEFRREDDSPGSPKFHQIALLHGILSYQTPELFSHTSEHFNHNWFLTALFNPIYKSCLTPCSSQYHAFSVLVSWLKTFEKWLNSEHLKFSNDSAIFSANTQIVSKILGLLASNWESPIKGVSGFVKEAYRVVVGLSVTECALKKLNFSMVDLLLGQVMKLSWKVKGKYLVLSVILNFVDFKKFHQQYPDVPCQIISNVRANYSATITSEVYKVMVMNMKAIYNADEFNAEWCKLFKSPIVESLCSNEKLLIQNLTNLILPWTLKTSPKLYEVLLDGFESENIAPQLMLLRIAKETGICTLREKEINLLRKYLHHHSFQLRIEIITIICCSPKKSEPMSFQELELLRDFISVNLNIDSAPFQQQFLSHMRILLARMRDSLVQQFRFPTKKAESAEMYPLQLEFIDWLAHTAVKNTFPGACFQRRRISLNTLNIIFDVFITTPRGNKRKEKPSKFVGELIKAAQDKGMWTFFSDDLLLNVFPCFTDFTDEIRSSTYSLIQEFSKWPELTNENKFFKPETLMKYAHSLCSHPDYRSHDGGALLVCLIYRKLLIKDDTFSESQCNGALMFLTDMVQTIENQLTNIKEKPSNADPIQGHLLALQYCIHDSKDVLNASFKTQNEKVMNFIQIVSDLCDDIIDYMLGIMKGDNDKNNCPDFSDIGQAIENLVITKQGNPCIPSDDVEKIEPKSNYLPEVELMLSCCWHSIKNSCFLLCELSFCICGLEMQNDVKKQYLLNIATKLSSILITCRHRGVVDACYLALNKFCTLLLKDDDLHEEICKFLLNSVFDALSDATSTSVTRRSAGLPSLIQAVVSSEQNNIKRKLLSYTVDKLLICVYQPLNTHTTISDKTDLPQAHAYHILKSLVTDSSLAQAILSHLDSIIPACVAGFSSLLWPIRNGALQLFGVLLPRICGQKKVRDDNSEHNLVSAAELFARCPSLKTYLSEQLEKCVCFHKDKKICSELVPVLSLIVKLSPPQEENGNSEKELKTSLFELIDVPIWKVRDLVSSALSVLMTTDDVSREIEELKIGLNSNSINCNKIHGMLLMIQKVLKRNNKHQLGENITASLVDLYNALQTKKCAVLLEILLDIILEYITHLDSHCMLPILPNVPEVKHLSSVGHALLDTKLALILLNSANNNDLATIIKKQVSKDTCVINECLLFLNNKLQSEINCSSIYEENNLRIWKDIFVAVLQFIKAETHPSIIQEALKFMIGLCQDWKIGSCVLDSNTSELVKNLLQPLLKMESGLSSSALSFIMLSFCIKSDLKLQMESTYLQKWNTLFNSYCQPRSPDILRMQAACSIACLGPTLVEFFYERIQKSENFQDLLIGLSEGSLLLLQDEDEDIRNQACEFPSHLPHQYKINSLQFNVGIQVIFECVLKPLQEQNYFILYFWNRLQNYPSTATVLHGLRSVDSQKKMNLFEQEYVNVYAEPIVILMEYKELLKNSLTLMHSTNLILWQEQMEMFTSDLKIEMNDLLNLLTCESTIEYSEGFAYAHQGFLALKKLHCQLEVLLGQVDNICNNSYLRNSLKDISSDWQNIKKHLTFITCWFLQQL